MSNIYTPIAYVNNEFTQNTPTETIRVQPSQLVIEPVFKDGLFGLRPGMDILVLFHFHRVEINEIELQLHPRHNPDNPITGVFNTRSQFRPNAIGASVARIEEMTENIITVTGLDAQNGTPVLDIKPYAPYFDTDSQNQRLEKREIFSLAEAREAIDNIDTEIIRLFGNRANFVHQVVKFKNNPEDVPAPNRYAQVMRQRREWAETAGLNPDVIEDMYKLLIDNFIKEELNIMKKRDEE